MGRGEKDRRPREPWISRKRSAGREPVERRVRRRSREVAWVVIGRTPGARTRLCPTAKTIGLSAFTRKRDREP